MNNGENRAVVYDPVTKRFYDSSNFNSNTNNIQGHTPLAEYNLETFQADKKNQSDNIVWELVELVTKILNQMYKTTNLIQGCNVIPSFVPKFDYDVAIKTPISTNDVPVQKNKKQQTYEIEKIDFDLDEFEPIEREIGCDEDMDLSTKNINLYANSIGEAINKAIINNALDESKEVKKDSWKEKNENSNICVNSALADVQEALAKIQANSGRPDTIVMHPDTKTTYILNSNVGGQNTNFTVISPGITLGGLPGFSTMTLIEDYDVPKGTVYIYEKQNMTIGDGRIVANFYRDLERGEYIIAIRKWIQPKVNEYLAENQAIKITGV